MRTARSACRRKVSLSLLVFAVGWLGHHRLEVLNFNKGASPAIVHDFFKNSCCEDLQNRRSDGARERRGRGGQQVFRVKTLVWGEGLTCNSSSAVALDLTSTHKQTAKKFFNSLLSRSGFFNVGVPDDQRTPTETSVLRKSPTLRTN